MRPAPREEDWPLEADTRIDPWTAERHELIAELVLRMCGDEADILDVGCGTGAVTRRLPASEGRRLFGVDVDENRLKFARQADLRVGAEYIRADALDPNLFPPAYFDVVLVCEILEHLDPEVAKGLVRNALRWRRRYGLFLLTVPNNRLLDPDETQTFTKKSVEALIGFSLHWESRCPNRWLLGWHEGEMP